MASVEPAGVLVGAGEVVAGGQGVGVVGAEDALAVGEGARSRGIASVEPPGRLGDGEVVAAAQGVGVVGAEDALTSATTCRVMASLVRPG